MRSTRRACFRVVNLATSSYDASVTLVIRSHKRHRRELRIDHQVETASQLGLSAYASSYAASDCTVRVANASSLRRQAGLGVPPVESRKRRPRSARRAPVQAAYPGHVWSWDFIFDRTTDGRPVKMLTVVDEYTRQCLVIHPARSITSDQVLDTLQALVEAWGAPAFMRSDNGSEFIARLIQDWCATADIQTLYIEPGSPWQNGVIESFHSRFRAECLTPEIFFSIAEARVVVEDYRRVYNQQRPHSSLGYKTPDEFAQALNYQPAETRPTHI